VNLFDEAFFNGLKASSVREGGELKFKRIRVINPEEGDDYLEFKR